MDNIDVYSLLNTKIMEVKKRFFYNPREFSYNIDFTSMTIEELIKIPDKYFKIRQIKSDILNFVEFINDEICFYFRTYPDSKLDIDHYYNICELLIAKVKD